MPQVATLLIPVNNWGAPGLIRFALAKCMGLAATGPPDKGRNAVSGNRRANLLLNWYELEGNNLIGEEALQDLSLDDALRLFDTPFWNGMYHCWAVENGHIAALQPYVQHLIDPAKYAYFVEAYRMIDNAEAP